MPSRAGERDYAFSDTHPPRTAGSVTVLVVTEDVTFGEACSRVLAEEGFAVTHARHSGHALLACLSGHPTDILITELLMQDGSGPALAERLKRHSPNLQSIYLSASATPDARSNTLVRPFTCADLLDRVYECLSPSQRAS